MSKVVIVGAGVSGVICAIYAKKNGNDVTLLERNDEILKKLLITGNGRCNYFNDNQDINNYHSNDMEILSNIITKENTDELLKFYEEIGIVCNVKNGYYYPYTNQAISVKYALLNKLEQLNVNIITNYYVENIKKDNNKFVINNDIVCDKLVISTGSKAYPKTGSDGNGYSLLDKFNLNISDINPSLVQLICDDKYLKKLSGIRCEAKVSFYLEDKFISSQTGQLQLTDYGLSGICIFNLSHLFYKYDKEKYIKINFIPYIESVDELIKYLDKRQTIMNALKISDLLNGILNYKLIGVILNKSNIKDINYSKLTNEEKITLCKNINSYFVLITSTKSFDSAQVCSGGLYLSEINLNMESKKIKNLYITGELLDVDGICGGYNLTFAFISGFLAGKNI